MKIQADLSVCTFIRKPGSSLKNLLSSLYQTAYPVTLEVIVVDLSSTPDRSILDDYPEVILYENPGQESYAKAMNRAMQLAHGRYISLWDHDATCLPGCLVNLLTFLDDTPDVGIASPRVTNAYGNTEPTCRTFHSPFSLLATHSPLGRLKTAQRLLKKHLSTSNPQQTEEVDWLASGVHCLRRELLEDIGYLDESMVRPFAEQDYYLRARKTGWHNFFCHEAVVHHARPDRYHQELSSPLPFPTVLTNSCRYLQRKWF